MQQYYLGVDVIKGYADFVILDDKKKSVEKNFQLDDTFDGHCLFTRGFGSFLMNILTL